MFSEVFTVICALLGIIGLLLLAGYAHRWLSNHFSNGIFGSGQRSVKIIECIGIAQDKQLMIVSVGRKLMLLGVTPNSVSKICDLDEEDLVSENDAEIPSATGFEAGFMKSLKKAFAERNRSEESTPDTLYKEDERNEKDEN